MRFRLILIVLISFLASQSYYESAVGTNFDAYNAKAISLGSASNIVDRSGYCLLFNPSNLSMFNKSGILFNTSLISNSIFERRGVIVKDSFGDYLAISDYVKNNSTFNAVSFSAKYTTMVLSKYNIGIGVSSSPLNSFNYYYEEEIRGQLDSDDGEIFSRDPLLGYHVFESNGLLNNINYGSSIQINITNDLTTAFGVAINVIAGNQSTTESINIDTTNLWYNSLAQENFVDENTELSDLSSYDVSYVFSPASFYTIGSSIKLKKYLVNVSIQKDAVISKNIDIDDLTEIYNSTIDNGLEEDNYIGNNHIVNHFMLKISDIYKPMKINIGFSILNKDSDDINFIANYEFNKYDDLSLLSSYSRFSIAVDHRGYRNIPLRFGIEYQTSPFKPYVSSISSFSMGTGFENEELILDFGINYKHSTYNFPDMFPVKNDYRPDLDIVNESNINFQITLSYKI